MKKGLLLFLTVLLAYACGTGKQAVTNEGNTILDDWVANREFAIASEWARPQPTTGMVAVSNAGLLGPGNTLGSISLIGNPNYFRVQGDSVSAYLPYYGERQIGGGYNSNRRIEFNGVPANLKITKDPKNKGYRMQFSIKEDSETYQVNVRLFPNLTSRMSVTSTHRFVIRYDGKIKELEVEEAL